MNHGIVGDDEYELFEHSENNVDQASSDRGGLIALCNFVAKPHLPVLLPALLCSALVGFIHPAMSIFFGRVFDSFSDFGGGKSSNDQLMDGSRVNTYGLVIIAFMTWIVKGCFFGSWIICGETQARTVRDHLFEALLRKDLEWYETPLKGVGPLLVRLQTQVHQLQIGMSQPLGFACTCVVQATVSTGVAFYYNWKLTLVVLGTAPVMIVVFSLAQLAMPEALRAYNAAQHSAATISFHILNNISTVKCSNAQMIEVTRYHQSIVVAARSYLKQALVNASEIGISRFGSTAVMIAGMYLGNVLVHQAKSTAQGVITTFWSCLATVQAVEDILPYLMTLERGRIAAMALQVALGHASEPQQSDPAEQGICPITVEGNVEFRNVSFSYPSRPDQFILHQASFCFPAGKTTFLVGKSGSGKSTVGNLLLRFYDARGGEILIDDYNIKSLNIDWLRNNVTLVEQQNTLFNTTLFRNVAFGRQDPSQVTYSQVQQCLEFALLSETTDKLPDGVNTELNNGGGTLSGGQKQRISIARARLRSTPILILDEPTSTLDYATRTTIMKNIRSWRKGKTTIIVTHDLALMNDDDYCYVLRDQRVTMTSVHAIVSTNLKHTCSRGDSLPVIDNGNLIDRERCCTFSTMMDVASSHGSSAFTERPESQLNIYRMLDELEAASFSWSAPLRRLETPRTSLALSYRLSVEMSNILNRQKRSADQANERVIKKRAIDNGKVSSRLRGSKMTTTTDIGSSHLFVPWSSYTRMRNVEQFQNMMRASSVTSTKQSKNNMFQFQEPQSLQHDPHTHPQSLPEIFLTIWPSLKTRQRVMMLGGFVAATAHAACTPLFSYFLAKLLATFYLQQSWHAQAKLHSLVLLGIAVGDGITSFLMHYLLEAVGQSWVDGIRLRAIQRIIQQPKEWFDDPSNQSSLVCSVLDRHADEMRNLLGRFAAPLCVVAVMITSSTIWALALCWQLTFVGIASAPILYSITKGFNAVCIRWEARISVGVDAINTSFVETFTNIRTIRALTQESWFHKEYTKLTSQTFKIGLKKSFHGGLLYGLIDGALHLVTAAIFGYGAVIVKSGSYSVETILTVFALLLFSTSNANAIVAYVPQITSSINAATHLLQLSQMSSGSHEEFGYIKLGEVGRSVLSGPIEFINQNFTYPSRTEAAVLRNVTFTIPPARCTAIVGTSGSGKSTIASLLLGLYSSSTTLSDDYSKPPTLLISGQDVRTLDIHSLRDLIAIVPQTPILIPGTVRENILYGNTGSQVPPQSRLKNAAKAADIHNFISTLPLGYDTVIGDGGLGLSGGQAQRIVIARALARNPQVLVLDEATSALDYESADIVMGSIKRLIKKGQHRHAADGTRLVPLTLIMITHTKEMMEWADHVVVMKDGMAVEEGGYRELLACKGELWRILSTSGNEGSSSRVAL